MINNNVILHIGLPKTGTTYLQKYVFNQLINTKVINGWNNSISHYVREASNSENYLITDESLSGLPFSGNYGLQFEKNIKTLSKIFGNAKVLFGIRNHSQLIFSLYKQYLNEGGYFKFDHFFNDQNSGIIKKEDLLLHEKIIYLKRYFDCLFVYNQEKLLDGNGKVETEILKFIENNQNFDTPISKKANVGLNSLIELNLLRRMNYLNYLLVYYLKFPSIYSRVFQKIGLTPRKILIALKLGSIFNFKKMTLSNQVVSHINEFYKDDINKIEQTLLEQWV